MDLGVYIPYRIESCREPYPRNKKYVLFCGSQSVSNRLNNGYQPILPNRFNGLLIWRGLNEDTLIFMIADVLKESGDISIKQVFFKSE